MSVHFEWRYWLLGVGWRTRRQAVVGSRVTLFLGPLRINVGWFGGGPPPEDP